MRLRRLVPFAFPFLLNVLLVFLHVPTDATFLTTPMQRDDFGFSYGMAAQSRDLFLAYETPWGYDPTVSCGYVVSPLWYPNNILPAAFLILFRFLPEPLAFNLYVVVMLVLWPLAPFAILHRHKLTSTARLFLATTAVYLVWSGILHVFLQAAMIPFVWTLFLIAFFMDVLERQTSRPAEDALTNRGAATLVIGVLLASTVHLAFGIAWCGLAAMHLVVFRKRLATRDRLAVAIATLAVVAFYTFLFRVALSDPAAHPNPHGSPETKLLIEAEPVVLLYFLPDALLLAVGTWFVWKGRGWNLSRIVLAGSATMFWLSFPLEGLLPIFDYRRSFTGIDNLRWASLFCVGCLPMVGSRITVYSRQNRRRWVAMTIVVAVLAVARLQVMPGYGGELVSRMFVNQHDGEIRELAASLRRSGGRGRVLFEDSAHDRPHLFDGHEAYHLSRFIGREIIQYPDDFVASKYHRFSMTDGRLAQRPIGDFSPEALGASLRLYAVTDVLVRTETARAAMDRLSESWAFAEEVGRFRRYFAKDPVHYFLRGEGTIEASRTEMRLTNLVPENGSVVIKYHYSPVLRAEPATVSLRPFVFDPAEQGFLEIENPPTELTIHFDGLKRPSRVRDAARRATLVEAASSVGDADG